jgi:hypothetical protein
MRNRRIHVWVFFFPDDDIDRFIEASLNWPSPIADNRWFDYIISVLPHSESTPHPDGHCVTHTSHRYEITYTTCAPEK